MAILLGLASLAGQFAGKVVTTLLGWATTLLFGHVTPARARVIAAIAFGSIVWVAALVGVIVPAAGTVLLTFIPQPAFVPDWVVRLVMVVVVVIEPAIAGGAIAWVSGEWTRVGWAGRARQVARGYPTTVLLAVLLVFLAGLSVYRKVRSARRGWSDAHVPLIVKPGRYGDVCHDLAQAIAGVAGETRLEPAPASMSVPARLLARAAGARSAGLVPDRLLSIVGHDLDALVYPSDVLISAPKPVLARTRAAIATRLATSNAYLTADPRTQRVEDELNDFVRSGAVTQAQLDPIDEEIASLPVGYEDWEVLYRRRLQVEHELNASAGAGLTEPKASPQPAPVVDQGITVAADGAGELATVAWNAMPLRWRLGIAIVGIAISIGLVAAGGDDRGRGARRSPARPA